MEFKIPDINQLTDQQTYLLQVQQQCLELVHHFKDHESLFCLVWKTEAWFTCLDLSYSSPHGLDLLFNHL